MRRELGLPELSRYRALQYAPIAAFCFSRGTSYPLASFFWLSNEELNWVPLRSIAQATLSSRSPTERRARAWL
jgi:hypothetical protein